MTKLIVVCTGDKSTRFDRNYYATQHLSLAMECWGRYGLEAADAFSEMERIMADVNNFTDSPLVMRTVFSPL